MLFSKILMHGSCKLFKITSNKSEYKRLRNTLAKKDKFGRLDEELVNDTLMGDALIKLAGQNEVYLLHDPSPIRKPHSTKTEHLGKVTDLNGKIINGYSTHNIIAIIPNEKKVHLLYHESYSNKEPHFLKAEHVKKIKEDKEFEGKEEAFSLYESSDWFNKKTITKGSLSKASKAIKNTHQNIKITHVLDREFDDDDYFSFIVDEKDSFVIRAKKSRTLSDEKDDSGKKIKLIESTFNNKGTLHIPKLILKKKCYQNISLEIEWKSYFEYHAVKITLKDREGKNIFKDPMLLITNKTVKSFEEAQLIYQIYLKRSRIECVFKFLKDGLGWEEIQLHNFQAIQNLLSIAFFVAAYLYEIEEQQTQDDFIVMLADLGEGNGAITRHYILQGIHAILCKIRVDRYLKEINATQEDIDKLVEIATMGTFVF